MQDEYTHTNILKIFPSVRARTLISWSERGLIQPLQEAMGRGSSRMYSYINLIEIAIISELLRYGISFSHIALIMHDTQMKTLLRHQDWDTVFWISRGKRPLPYQKADISVGFMYLNDFLRNAGDLIIGNERTTFTSKTSAILVNISALKYYVDNMIKKL